MAEQERRHLDAFNKLIPERRVRPTALLPFWHVAGFALGAGTALLGEKAAHACTVAVEEVIDEHYAGQVRRLREEGVERDLLDTFEEFRLEEVKHKEDMAIHHGLTLLDWMAYEGDMANGKASDGANQTAGLKDVNAPF